jgi:outer membrane protein TolC
MKQIILFSALLVLSAHLFSQNSIDLVLAEIEKNNTTLSAIRKNTDAEKIGNRTGIYLQNPEAEFNYLWGNPASTGDRTDFSITQSFDFPTAYSHKNQISNLKNEQAELDYQKQRKSILLQTRMVCVDLVYMNALKSELSKRLANAERLANSYKSKYEIGEAGILEYNKSQVTLLNIAKDAEAAEIERNALLTQLASLNGGVIISFSDSIYPLQTIAPDFTQWYAQAEQGNPVLQWIAQEIEISRKRQQLGTALSLPKFHAGYMSENLVGQQFQGITAGISIPLWENKNTVKYARAKTIAVQGVESDARLQFYNEMKALHAKVIRLQTSVADYRESLLAFSNTELAKKALEMGEISLAEYLFELTVYYESFNKLLEMERNLNTAVAELNRYL